jgi:uncharacterized protein
VEDIAEQGLDLLFSDPEDEWNRYLKEMPVLQFSVNSRVEVNIGLKVSGGAVHVHGWLQTGLDLQCCRCLGNFAYPLASQIDVTLIPETDLALEEEVELEKQDLEAIFFSGDEVDLSGLIREQIILNVPFKALCHEECRGLCSRCGANQNDGECGCEVETRVSVFDALKDIKLNGTGGKET